jgi:hypothetical protein
MAALELELRVAALEAQVAQLTQKLLQKPEELNMPAKPWWQEVYGTFADDPLHEEAMRLGREYRESLRPTDSTESANPLS